MSTATRRLRRASGAGPDGLSSVSLIVVAGAGTVIAARAAMARLLLIKLRRNVRALNAGDVRPVLSNYGERAVLVFNEGEHRWAGEHRGKPAIARFLENFVGAGLQGDVTELFLAGPPWRMTLLARFDDHAHGPAGEELYRNRTVLLARTRWGRIVRQEDFYEDTQAIAELERSLATLGISRRQ
jgi:ketosteroid isomerase-like protein